jgi:hypothetical protein
MAQLEHIEAIERRLWSAADTLRANSNIHVVSLPKSEWRSRTPEGSSLRRSRYASLGYQQGSGWR